jgi:hypothetical protein
LASRSPMVNILFTAIATIGLSVTMYRAMYEKAISQNSDIVVSMYSEDRHGEDPENYLSEFWITSLVYYHRRAF